MLIWQIIIVFSKSFLRNTSFRVQDICQVHTSGDWYEEYVEAFTYGLGYALIFLFKIA